MIHTAEHCSPHGLSYDDIDLFARLRSITIIKGIVMPPKVSKPESGNPKPETRNPKVSLLRGLGWG